MDTQQLEQLDRYAFLRKSNFELYALCRDADHYAAIDSIIVIDVVRRSAFTPCITNIVHFII